MALSFPSNPVNGQVYSRYIYDSSISAWRNINNSEGIGLQYTSGLVPVIPTSVVVGSGSASVSTDGVVTFTNASYISFNGIFSSAYKNYQIIHETSSRSTTSWSVYRLRASGTDNISGYDRTISAYTNVNTPQANASTNGTDFGFAITATAMNNTIMEIMSPNLSTPTTTHARWLEGSSGSAIYSNWGHGFHRSSTSFDGLSVIHASGTATGTIRIYGFR